MTLSGLTPADQPGLPVVPPTLIPPDVRAGGARGERLYAACLGFEQLLTQALTSQIGQTLEGTDPMAGDPGGDGPPSQSIFDTGSDPTSSMYGQMIPDALNQGLTGAGGLGLADELYRAFAQRSGIPIGTGSST